MQPKVRLQKFIAECGVASRRNAEKLISANRVSVNGNVAKLGAKINPDKDKVFVDGKLLKQREPKIYIKLNKPRGVVSSCRKFEGEETILDIVRNIPFRLYPIGRLDKDSEGLIILTNDGYLANRLMHPRYEHEKEYEVNLRFPIINDQLKKLEQGVVIDGKKTLPAKVSKLDKSKIKIVLKEGKKRQIRMMIDAVKNKVVYLRRVRIKNIQLGQLMPGKYAYLTASEVHEVLSL